MVMDKFSVDLPEFTGSIENPDLQDSLYLLETLIGYKIKFLDWGNNKIAVPVELEVDLPSLGNFDNLDIRSIEPVIIVFDLYNYPVEAPRVYSDRSDFPKNNLAHLYVSQDSRPPAFCYVRGNAAEWYSNRTIKDLLIRIRNWLRDAATGELTENGDEYEPLRLEGYVGTIIYDYDTMLGVVKNNTALKFDQEFSIALFERVNSGGSYTYKFVKLINVQNALATIKEVDEERKKNRDDVSRKKYYYGYVLWGDENSIRKEYEINIPDNWEAFKKFCDYYFVKYAMFEKFITTFSTLNEYIYFPVIIGIRRPKPLIGYSSDIEFINLRFQMEDADVKEEKIISNLPVRMLSHKQPLTMKLAAEISGRNLLRQDRTVIFGCGALGSKVILHIARSGQTNMLLIDPDDISPHNLVRHGLFGEDEGENKAEALADRIKKIYPYESTKIYAGPSFKDGLIEKTTTFEKYKWILDFTASEAFFNKLNRLNSLDKNKVASASISDFGSLGILYVEGEGRNPRLDDLQAYLYSLSVSDADIENWLAREASATDTNSLIVQVGVGCNSETTILADDIVSAHAAYFSGAIKREMDKNSNEGKIYLHQIAVKGDFHIQTKVLMVQPFIQFTAVNNPKWNIRFAPGIVEQLTTQFALAGAIETGGVLAGICNHKTKTIHVSGLVNAPRDSKRSPTQFIRGHAGLPSTISAIEKKSGGQVGYIGEWHTHPAGPDFLSEDDMESVDKHKNELAELPTPLPVFLSIVTPNGIFPYVF